MSSMERGSAPPVVTTEFPRRAFLPAAMVFIGLQVIGTITAVANRLPYEVAGIGDPDRVASDFLMGGGTALSAPLILLVLLAALIWAARRADRWGTLALVGTALVTGVATVFGALEPIAGRMLGTRPFGLYEAVIVVLAWGSVLASAAIAVLSLVILAGRMRR